MPVSVPLSGRKKSGLRNRPPHKLPKLPQSRQQKLRLHRRPPFPIPLLLNKPLHHPPDALCGIRGVVFFQEHAPALGAGSCLGFAPQRPLQPASP